MKDEKSQRGTGTFLRMNLAGKVACLLVLGTLLKAAVAPFTRQSLMDIESLRRIELAKIEQKAEELARNEVKWLNERFRGQAYTFDFKGVQISIPFLRAETDSSGLPNDYRILLIAASSEVVQGQCWIVDSNGRRLGSIASTDQHETGNRIVLATLAVP